MKILIKCVHQVNGTVSTVKDAGNCRICTYNPEENEGCTGHIPVAVVSVEIEEK